MLPLKVMSMALPNLAALTRKHGLAMALIT